MPLIHCDPCRNLFAYKIASLAARLRANDQPLAIVYGWNIAREFLDGAHDLDTHFVTAHARSNLPILLALCDVWNDAFLGTPARVVTPFASAYAAYPSFVAALEAQACTRSPAADDPPTRTTDPASVSPCPSLVVDGGTDSALDRSLYQSGQVVNAELIATFDSQVAFNARRGMVTGPSAYLDGAMASQDALLCSLFAHADELALGKATDKDPSDLRSVSTSPAQQDEGDASDGNRPSLLLLTGKVDAFVCGQLVALAEHRAAIKAHLWGIDPFVGRCGASLRVNRTDQLKEMLHAINQGSSVDEDEDGAGSDGRSILSTRTLLRHYANYSRDLR
jgi:glucose-6-phosphate isomerase